MQCEMDERVYSVQRLGGRRLLQTHWTLRIDADKIQNGIRQNSR